MHKINHSETAEIQGGLWAEIAIGLAIYGTAAYLYDNREQFVEGVKDGFCSLYGCS